MSAFLKTKDLRERYGCSPRTIKELTRKRLIPFRINPGTRPCLFDPIELDKYDAGDYDDLEVRDLPQGGVIVRLVRNDRRAA